MFSVRIPLSLVPSKTLFAQFVCTNVHVQAGSRQCLSPFFHTPAVFIIFLYIHTTFRCRMGKHFIPITPQRGKQEGQASWKLAGDQTSKPTVFGRIIISPRRGIWKSGIRLKGNQREKISGCKTERMTVGYEDERNRTGKKPFASGNFVLVLSVGFEHAGRIPRAR